MTGTRPLDKAKHASLGAAIADSADTTPTITSDASELSAHRGAQAQVTVTVTHTVLVTVGFSGKTITSTATSNVGPYRRRQ